MYAFKAFVPGRGWGDLIVAGGFLSAIYLPLAFRALPVSGAPRAGNPPCPRAGVARLTGTAAGSAVRVTIEGECRLRNPPLL